MLFVVCLRPVPCVPNVVSVSGLFVLDCSFGFLERLFVTNTSTDHVVCTVHVHVLEMVCGLFEWKSISAGFFYWLFISICIV